MRDAISDVFAALADITRRHVYEQLLKSPRGRTATDLAHVASVSRQAIVKNLQILVASGLAHSEREGREVRYFVATNGTIGLRRGWSIAPVRGIDELSRWRARYAPRCRPLTIFILDRSELGTGSVPVNTILAGAGCVAAGS